MKKVVMKKKTEFLSDKVENLKNRTWRANLCFVRFRKEIEEDNFIKFIQNFI